ncbi:MAG: hypothetical protein ACREAB_08510, partial [Blastocatellia bacterium]
RRMPQIHFYPSRLLPLEPDPRYALCQGIGLQIIIQPDSSGLQTALAEAAAKPDESGWKNRSLFSPSDESLG